MGKFSIIARQQLGVQLQFVWTKSIAKCKYLAQEH